MFTDLVKSLAAAHGVSVKSDLVLLQLCFVVCLEAYSVHPLSILFFDDHRCSVPSRKAWDNTCLEQLLRWQPHKFFMPIHIPFKTIYALWASNNLSYALLTTVTWLLVWIWEASIYRLMLTAWETILAVVSCSSKFAMEISQTLMHNYMVIVLSGFAIHGRNPCVCDGRRTTKITIIKVVLVHNLRVDLRLDVHVWLDWLAHFIMGSVGVE